MTRTHVFRLNYVWWMDCGWMALSGLLVLVVQYVGKFSLPEGGSIIFLLVFLFLVFLRYNGGFWHIHIMRSTNTVVWGPGMMDGLCGRFVVPEGVREEAHGYQLRLETAPVLLCRFLIIGVEL